MYSGYNIVNLAPKINTAAVASLIIGVIAIILGILIYVLFMRQKNSSISNGNAKKLHNFLNFKVFVLPELVKITYVILAIYLTIYSFVLIPTSFGLFLLVLIFGNVLLRISYEVMMLLFRIEENTRKEK